MQSASADLIAAIGAASRQPLVRVTVGWAGDGFTASSDVTGVVVSASVSRGLQTDLPAEAKQTTGFAAATGTVELAGDIDGYPVVELLSPLRDAGNLLTGRVNVSCVVEYGMRTASGPAYLKALTGRVRHVELDVASGRASLELMDLRSALSARVTVPVVAADDFGTAAATAKKPGLNGQWVIDYVLRQCGFYASPPPRANCVLSATMHGSAYPDIGELVCAWTGRSSAELQSCEFSDIDAPLVSYLTPGPSGVTQVRYAPSADTLSTNNGATVRWEGWVLVGPTGDLRDICYMACDDDAVASITLYITGGDDFRLEIYRGGDIGGSQEIISGPSVSEGWHYLGVHITFTSSTIDCQFRVDDTTTQVVDGSSPSTTGRPAITTITMRCEPGNWVEGLEAVQVSTGAWVDTWYDTFSPTATLQSSRNKLTAVPLTAAAEAWSIVQQVAAAELGVAGFAEDGTAFFRNRTSLVSGSSVASITSTTNLTTLGSGESLDSVRNVVRVPAQPLRLDPAEAMIWVAGESIYVASGATVTVWATFDSPVHSIDDTFVSLATSGSPLGSGYRANTLPDGTGTNITSGITVTATKLTSSVKLDVFNGSGQAVWLVNPTATGDNAGQPSLRIFGRLLRPLSNLDSNDTASSGYLVERTNSTSIASYGETTLDVAANPFMQSLAAAEALADSLILRLAQPRAVLSGIEIVGDPRLQLGDRVTVTEPDGLGLDSAFVVTDIDSRSDSGGFMQTVALREAQDVWILGDTVLSNLGVTTILDG